MRLRIATFNIENLFTRFDFAAFSNERSRRYLPPIVNFLADLQGNDLSEFDDFRALIRAASVAQDDDKRQHTALAINDADADLLCLQEVDSQGALDRFNDFYIKKIGGKPYTQIILHEGNDYRGIDVAAMAKAGVPVMSRSHAGFAVSSFGKLSEREPLIARYPLTDEVLGKGKGGRIFRRDCLELEIRQGGKELTVFVCHFKSMGGAGRRGTIPVRQAEALAVKQIIETKFDDPATANWLIVGDLNDYRSRLFVSSVKNPDGSYTETVKPLNPDRPESGLDPLLDDGFSTNLVERRGDTDRWTHYYSLERNKTQLDYILASPAMAQANTNVPEIIRSGNPFRVPNSNLQPRYPRIGWDRPKASDHCPVVIDVDVP